MLYGTRKELNKKLKRMFGNEERYALLVWTPSLTVDHYPSVADAQAEIAWLKRELAA
jgi:hypothetical protein